MPKPTLSNRVTRLEKGDAENRKSITRLNNAMAHLAEETLKTQEQIVKTQEQIAETNRHLRELGEETDRRIRDLVSAIGDLIRHQRNGK